MPQTAFFTELGSALHTAAEQRHGERRRRSHRIQVVAAAAVIATAIFGAVTFEAAPQEPAGASVEVEVTGGRLELRLADLEADPGEITRAASEAGLDVRVVEVPVGPSMVGRFIDMGADRPLPRTLERHDSVTGGFSGFSIPRWWDGQLTLSVGRAARAGESYKSSSNAFAPGEPLECVNIVGRAAGDAERQMAQEAADTVIRWRLTDRQPARYVGVSRHFDAIVTGAQAVSARDLIVDITAEPNPALSRPRLDWCRRNTQ